MRFDDRLDTALRQSGGNGAGASAQWQQLIDVLAQNPRQFSTETVAVGLMQARLIADQVSLDTRVASVRGLAGRIKSPPLVQLLAGDNPAVAAEAIAGARLTDEQWADIIPQLPVRARGFLRNRNDLGPGALRALNAYSAGDFSLPNPGLASEESHSAGGQSTQIRDIVERIEKLRLHREQGEAPQLPLEGGDIHEYPEPIVEIRFETDEHGTVCWVEGAPRGAIVGIDIADPAFDQGPGPDAYGAAAFRQRMPLENIRMRLCGSPLIDGDWRINAAPFFDAKSGRFNGYRGIFRRPTIAESALIEVPPAENGEQLQSLVHELRTPLGAIIGFAEIIEQQLFGPVTDGYRTLARNILHDAERLLSGFDDLAMAARIETGHFVAPTGMTECGWLASRLAERLRGLSDLLGVTLNLVNAHPVRPFAIENELAERLFSRLLSAVIIGCEAGEELNGRFRTEPGQQATNRFVLTLPVKLRSMSEADLFGSGPGPHDEVDEAPLLGLGFSLRLVRNLARNVGGDLRFYNEALILSLPAIQNGSKSFKGTERD